MEIRPLRPEEMAQYAKILKAAFVTEENFPEIWLKMNVPEDMRAIFDDSGKLMAGLRLIDMEIWFGAHPVKVSGVTNVATPPENRRQGHLKQLLRATLAENREQGYSLSALYPFEFPFYRKFGYELAAVFKHVKVSMGAMAQFKSQEKGQWVESSFEDLPLFREIYAKFCTGHFGPISRTKDRWWRYRVFNELTPGGDKPRTAYLWRDAAGTPRAYLLYTMKTLSNDWEREMRIREMAWTDEAARHEIFSFIANHDSQAVSVSWATTPSDDFFSLLSDPRQAEMKLEPGYMLRLVDVERALTERAWPILSGKEPVALSIGVRDDVLTWNDNQTYSLRVAPGQGQAEVSKEAGIDKAGLLCDVRTLAQLYAGYLSPQEAVRLRKLEVRRAADLEAAQSLFSPAGQPAAFMNDGF